jgi:hypothetical protein
MIGAGYLLIRRAPRNDWQSAELLPDQILSASPDVSQHFPGDYALAWVALDEAYQRKQFERMGLPKARRASVTAWATENFGQVFGWPGVFYDLPDAFAARYRFLADIQGVHLVGLGLPEHYLEQFLDASRPPAPEPGYAPMGASGQYEIASERQPLAAGGQLLGFELLNFDCGQISHSWLCNGLEKHCFQALGVRPATHGLLPDLDTAERCYAEISQESVGKEPGLWLPWALVGYA